MTGRPLVRVVQTGSTNDDARRLALAGAPHGAAVVADHQTAGRGRLGRAWQSPPGANLLLSVVLREGLDAERLGLLSFAAALAVTDVCGSRWRIKWPNDVVDADGRKLAGILAEAEWSGGRPAFVVVGIGVNVTARPPDLPAVALGEVGRAPDRVLLALAVVDALVRWAGAGPREVVAEWRARSHTLGRWVRVGDVEGSAEDVAEDGGLVLRGADGARRVVRAGDVTG